MKIIKEAWETRYKKLAINFSCRDCGTEFTAEGEDFRRHALCGVTVVCPNPNCGQEIHAESAIKKVADDGLVEYIRSLPPIR